MKRKFITLFLLFAFLPFASGIIWIQPSRFSAGGTCTDLVAFLPFGANNGAVSVLGQKIKNTAGMTVCSVKIAGAGSGNATVQIWSAIDGGTGAGTGTPYGSASNTTALPGSIDEITFTWASNPNVPSSTDFYLVITGSFSSHQEASGPDAYETGNGYDYFVGGASQGAKDLRFELKTIQ